MACLSMSFINMLYFLECTEQPVGKTTWSYQFKKEIFLPEYALQMKF